MKKLADAIVEVIVNEYGTAEFLRRLSNPFWFQSLGCVLGYDWHSSGVTTVVTGVLKSVLSPEKHGVTVAGGKGSLSRRTPNEIMEIGEKLGFSSQKIAELVRISRLTAKVDNVAIQDGYTLYHHAFFIDEKGNWAVIQQGMNVDEKTARRYHWNSEKAINLIEEPHNAIISDKIRKRALNLTDKSSERCRKVCIDIARERPVKVKRLLSSIVPRYQSILSKWIQEYPEERKYYCDVLYMPRRIDWKALERAYSLQPKNFEQLLEIKGVGPSLVRALALISEIIYGEAPSWRDPAKFSFAFGGKDGVPFPVDRDSMDRVYQILTEAIEKAKIGDREKLSALQRLKAILKHL